MKKFLCILVAVMSINAMGAVKIGIVNIGKIIDTVNEGKSVNDTLKKSFDSKQAQLKKEEEKIKKLQEDYKKQSMVLTDAAKAKKENEMRATVQKIQQMQAKFQKEIQKQEAELKKPLLEKLKPIIDAVSKEEKVTMTFEITSSPVVYAETKVDLTEKVIKAYDKKHKK